MARTEMTTWDVWTYDVWGNEDDGYEVNDRYNQHRDYEIECAVEVYNAGTPQQFESAYPSDEQIREALGLRDSCQFETDGDDLTIYVNTVDGYPLGELNCTSHESLSAIRKAA